jgi:lysophospholipase L1-like esterase
VLQWNSGRVDYLNVLDVLHDAGKDGWLAAAWMTPPPASTAADSGLAWPQVVARHDALLDGNAALRAAYFAVPDPLQRYGLPMTAPTEEGPALVVRCQRAVLQLWQQPEPWAAAGTVTVANAGDILKASGLLPATALLPAPAPTAAPFTYVALGASDAAGDGASSPANGYVALLAAKLAARYPDEHTVNLGIPGATTAQVVAQEGSQLASLRPTLVTITVGPNDLLRSVPADQFQSELDELLTQARQSGAQVVALANLPDVALAPAVPALLKPEAHDAVLAYNQVIAREAQARGAILVDLYDPSEQLLPAHPELISADGFHPSDAGYAEYAALFWAALQPLLP